jgi:FAD/FMN-containing dehydrogenase
LTHADAKQGFANIDDGITIDLSAMNKLQINHAVNTVSVGAGARWQSVYDALDPYSLSVQGGRNGHVGVGGYLLGGIYMLCFP